MMLNSLLNKKQSVFFNFTSFRVLAFLLISFLSILGCQNFNIKSRDSIQKPLQSPKQDQTSQPSPEHSNGHSTERPAQPSSNISDTNPPAVTQPLPTPIIPAVPKIGIILGAGGAKTFAHIGFLHELNRSRIPVFSIGGVELAAPMAALFASRETANDVEWQMFKLKDEDIYKKTILGTVQKNGDVATLKEFANAAFSKSKAEDFKIPFACPSYNFRKNQVYLMNRGPLDQILFFCVAYPPFYQPYQGNISAVREISSLANYLRQRGANYIVFVNVLQNPGWGKPFIPEVSTTDNILWNEIAGTYNKPITGIDSVINLDTSEYSIVDFDKRREIMNRGSDSAIHQLKSLGKKWGL